MKELAILEGLLFIVGDDGLKINDIMDILQISEDKARKLLKELQKEYENENRGLRISFLADSFKLTTKKEHIEYYKKLFTLPNVSSTLSQAALETLAIIAYNQPITRVQIDEMRGISSAFLVKKLMAKDLIKVCGKSSLPGKPNLYKTTDAFLDYFGLASISELPNISIDESSSEDNQIDLYKSKYTE